MQNNHSHPRISIRNILREGCSVATKSYAIVFPLFLCVFLMNQYLLSLILPHDNQMLDFSLKNSAIMILLYLIMTLASTLAFILIARCYQQKLFAFLDSFTVTCHIFPKVLLASIINSLIIGTGMLLFVIPGLIAATFFAIYMPIIIFESSSVLEALKRSAERVKNHFTITAALISLKILLILGSGPFVRALLHFLNPDVSNLLDNLMEALTSALIYPFILGVLISLYFNLSRK